MRVTICELPHEPAALYQAWGELCRHTASHQSQFVVLPEFAMVESFWESPRFDPARWKSVETLGERWLSRLPELGAEHVVSTRALTDGEGRFNQGFVASALGVVPLRRKFYLPSGPGGWEARWYDKGDASFPAFRAGGMTFGLNICTELWALESYGEYARRGVHAVLSPRATAASTTAKWMSVGTVAAVRSGAFCISSNRVDATGAFGGVGWVISPDGEVLATTSRDEPFVTVEIDLAAAEAARATYPRYVFA
ncbi:MAG TPA: carbon-nitrogen hydrolase family protein [Gemmatimonadaceae bacterium]